MKKIKEVFIPVYGDGISGDTTIYISEQCFECKHIETDSYQICKAFPEGIPEDILTGEFDHTEKHPGQKNDIVFEPIEE